MKKPAQEQVFSNFFCPKGEAFASRPYGNPRNDKTYILWRQQWIVI